MARAEVPGLRAALKEVEQSHRAASGARRADRQGRIARDELCYLRELTGTIDALERPVEPLSNRRADPSSARVHATEQHRLADQAAPS